MARIELRYSTIRFIDGYSNSAAINDTPANLDTNMDIDTVGDSGIIPLTTRFSFVGADELYTVTAQDGNALLTIDLSAGTGNYTITIGGQTTANIAHTAIDTAILAAIVALSNVAGGDFSVTKVSSVITVKALPTGAFGNIAVVMSGDVSALVSGTPTAVQTHAGGVTTNITFTPALKTATLPINNAALTFTGRTLEVKIGDGNCQFTENRNYTYDLDRGLLDTVRKGDEVPIDVSLDFVWEFLTALDGIVTPTISDVLHHRGPAADWESSSDDGCEDFCFDIEIEYTPPCGDQGSEIITLPDFRWEQLPHSLTDAQVSMTGKCNATEAIVGRLIAD